MKKIRYIPFGYTVRNGKTIVDHNEAEIIREIFETYINGASLKDIAENLTARRIPYTEKTDDWDKARIARIIDNAKYIGDSEYDPIINEDIFESAVNCKIARQRNTVKNECEAIGTIRNRVKCEKCGNSMIRRICSKRRIKESWTCSNPECGSHIRISDGFLLEKITIQLNRIISNCELMVPKPKIKLPQTPLLARLQSEIDIELNRQSSSEIYLIEKVLEMASEIYRTENTKQMIAAQIAKKRIEMMQPSEQFSSEIFADLIEYITIDDRGYIKLYTKTDTVIEEGEDGNGSNEDT